MKAVKMILAGGVAAAALVGAAAPAAAQYYPGYGYPQGGNVVGQILNQVLGGNAYGYNNYGINSQAAIQRCAAAVTQRINASYGGYSPYGGGYGYNGYNGYAGASAQVVGITSVERRSNNGLRIRGVASSGAAGGYGNGYGYNGYAQPNLTFKCNIDYRGYISDIDLNRSNVAYGTYQPYGYNGPNNYYGYPRY